MPFHKEETRIRNVYQKRDEDKKPALYAWHHPDSLWNSYRVKSQIARALQKRRLTNLKHKTILDIGCGNGNWLRTLQEWGAKGDNLHGIDLLEDRIERAKELSPAIDFQCSSGFELSCEDQSMDLVFAFTVFSSIIDANGRKAMAAEMQRVLRPGGVLVIFDFHISHPGNPDTIGIGKSEMKRLFPELRITKQSLILAPPLARRICRVSLLLTHGLEILFPFLRSHSLFLISQ